MHLPIKLLKLMVKLPDRDLPISTVLGSLLREKEFKFKELNQIKMNSWYHKLKAFPPRKLAEFGKKFDDYITEAYETYNIEFPVIEFGKNPKDYKDFKALYGDIIDIKEREFTKYFDAMFPSVDEGVEILKPEVIEGENPSEKLPYTLKKAEIFIEKLVVNSQNNSVKRMEKIPELSTSNIKSEFFVYNINTYILNQKDDLTDEILASLMERDIAELNVLGILVSKANKVIVDFMFTNFDQLSENFF